MNHSGEKKTENSNSRTSPGQQPTGTQAADKTATAKTAADELMEKAQRELQDRLNQELAKFFGPPDKPTQ